MLRWARERLNLSGDTSPFPHKLPGPTGRNPSAQGRALGIRCPTNSSGLKGRVNQHAAIPVTEIIPPFQGGWDWLWRGPGPLGRAEEWRAVGAC